MPDLSSKTNVISFINFYRKSFHNVYIRLTIWWRHLYWCRQWFSLLVKAKWSQSTPQRHICGN